MRLLLLLPILAFPCSKPFVFGGWLVDDSHITTDSTYIDGKMTVVGGHATAFANMVCPDSVKADKDTTKAK